MIKQYVASQKVLTYFFAMMYCNKAYSCLKLIYVNGDLFNLGKKFARTAIDHILLCCIFGPLKKMVTGAGGVFCRIRKKKMPISY